MKGRPRPAWLRRFARNGAGMLGLVGVVLVLVMAFGAPLLAPHDPARQYFDGLTLEGDPLPPSRQFPLGTDTLGRDLLSRVLFGARVSLLVGVLANGAAVLIGLLVGVAAGYFRGAVEAVLMRLTDVMTAFPALILAIALAAILRPSLWIVALVIALVNWVWIARAIYAQVLSIRQREFVEAAEAAGASTPWILVKHVLTNSLSPILVAATLDVGFMIMAAAGMSFLGLGAQPPLAEWGVMLSNGRQFLRVAPWVSLVPGAMIFLVVLALNLLGDRVRDLLDPRMVGR